MTREELLESIKIISEKANDDEEIMERLKEIDNYIKEIELENSKTETSVYKQEEVFDTDGVSWKDKYIDVKNKYRDRFFNDTPEQSFINEVERRQDDTDKFVDDRSDITIEDLFKERRND